MAENIRNENAGSTSSQPAEPEVAESGTSVPRVIRFGYRKFQQSNNKWIAECTRCSKTLRDAIGVTTSFTK